MALNIVENFPLADWGPGSADACTCMIEATKLAFADSRRYSADPDFEDVPVERCCRRSFGRRRAAEIDLKRAKMPVAAVAGSATPPSSWPATPRWRSPFIQSVFSAWGSAS